MKSFLPARSLILLAACSVVILGLAGCAADSPANAANGPGVENPAAAAPNSVMPAVGSAGNGGGMSGGGAGAGGVTR